MNELNKYYPNAKRYNKEYKDVTQDINFNVHLAKEYANGGNILELGCGTGRITFKLVEQAIKSNFNIIGVDASSIMLEHAKGILEKSSRSVKNHLKLVQGDMRDVYFEDNYFDLVLITFNSFLHLKNSQDYLKTLNNIYKKLKPGGYFMADIASPGFDTEDLEKIKKDYKPKRVQGDYEIIDEDTITIRKGDFEYNPFTQILSGNWHYKIYKNDVNKELIETFSTPIEIRYILPKEYQELLQKTGFEIIYKWGDYDRNEFTKNSDNILFLCRKPTK